MRRVLIVEDNDMSREMLARRLTRCGYAVVVAADGQQGLELAGAERPDVILMDLSLPIVDGLEAARRLKGSDHTRRIPVIALTAHAMAGDRSRAIDAGCDEYDTKPIDFPRLLEKITTLTAGGALR